MTYEFSITSFFIGLLILGVGAAFVKWHQQVADNLGGGMGSYERYKLWAFITCGLGLVVMVNLHAMILIWFFGMLFPGR
jgi:cadmium resistance protein CadD (predicted permease)